MFSCLLALSSVSAVCPPSNVETTFLPPRFHQLVCTLPACSILVMLHRMCALSDRHRSVGAMRTCTSKYASTQPQLCTMSNLTHGARRGGRPDSEGRVAWIGMNRGCMRFFEAFHFLDRGGGGPGREEFLYVWKRSQCEEKSIESAPVAVYIFGGYLLVIRWGVVTSLESPLLAICQSFV